MKALSVRQPWAWLIVNRIKDVENRTWRTNYRGLLAIHASKTVDGAAYDVLRARGVCMPELSGMLRGGIVGTVDVVDCVDESDSAWFTGPHALVLASPLVCEFVPARGQLGIFNIPLDPALVVCVHNDMCPQRTGRHRCPHSVPHAGLPHEREGNRRCPDGRIGRCKEVR